MQKTAASVKQQPAFSTTQQINFGHIEGAVKNKVLAVLEIYGFDLGNLESSSYGCFSFPVANKKLDFLFAQGEGVSSKTLVLVLPKIETNGEDSFLSGEVSLKNKYSEKSKVFKTFLIIESKVAVLEFPASTFLDIFYANRANLHKDYSLDIPFIIISGDEVYFDFFKINDDIKSDISIFVQLASTDILKLPKKSIDFALAESLSQGEKKHFSINSSVFSYL